MNAFTYSYPVKVYFGEKAAEKNLAAELLPGASLSGRRLWAKTAF